MTRGGRTGSAPAAQRVARRRRDAGAPDRADCRRRHSARCCWSAPSCRNGSRPTDPLPSTTARLLQPPSWAHPFGTDNFGRDILSRVIWATAHRPADRDLRDPVPGGVRHLRRCAGRLCRRPGRRAVPPAGRPADHHPVPGAGHRHRRGAGAGAAQHVHRRHGGRLGVLRAADARRDHGAEAARLCRRRPRHGLRQRTHHLPPSAAERHHAGRSSTG